MSPVQGKSPLVQVKEHYGNFDMVTCRLSSCKPGVYNAHLLIMLESECQAVFRERKDKANTLNGQFQSLQNLFH